MRKYGLLLLFILLYLAIIFPFTSLLKNKPFVEKIGYAPEPGVLNLLSADQHQFAAAYMLMRVISYYGAMMEQPRSQPRVRPEFPAMQKMIESAIHLDPYNMDAYYFLEAMVWNTGQVTATNAMLDYGMKYRTWDFYLPYFAGFNSAFFLKDYASAADYYRRVADMTGDDLIIRLAGRYFFEAGRTDTAIAYLSHMIKSSNNDAIRKTLQTRLDAFIGAKKIEQARDKFEIRYRRMPHDVEELVRKGFLSQLPVDPYGGKFYIKTDGQVQSTSKFAFGIAGTKMIPNRR